MNDRTMLVRNEQNQEIELEILFTYEDPQTHLTYVFYFNPLNDSEEVFVSRYDDQGHLFPVEDEILWERLSEILTQYQVDDEETEE